MRIKYVNTLWHVYRFHLVNHFTSPLVQLFYVGIPLLFVRMAMSEAECEGAVVCFAFGAGYFLVVYIPLFALQQVITFGQVLTKKSKSVLTEHIVEVRDEGLSEETRYNTSLFQWSGLHKVIQRPGFVSVYVAADSALIIPNAAFSSKEERREFIRSVREKSEKA